MWVALHSFSSALDNNALFNQIVLAKLAFIRSNSDCSGFRADVMALSKLLSEEQGSRLFLLLLVREDGIWSVNNLFIYNNLLNV